MPVPGLDEVLVETRFSSISRGTEGLVFGGRVPRSEWERMRAPFQAGTFEFPIKYGYASVGRVVGGLESRLGERVFCLYPHQDRYVVPEAAAVRIPDALPDERAGLAANLETALNGLWDGAPRLGDRIAIVGAGVVGALVAALAAGIPGTRVELVDLDPAKAEVAAALGVAFARPDEATGEADLVIHASGSGAGLDTALRLAGFEATVVELSWYGQGAVPSHLGEAFHSRRLTLRSSQVGHLPPERRTRWTHAQRLALALRLLADPRFDALLEPATPFFRLPQVMAELAAGRQAMCILISYP